MAPKQYPGQDKGPHTYRAYPAEPWTMHKIGNPNEWKWVPPGTGPEAPAQAMDGILAPKPFKDAWKETMGEPEYKAVYALVCQFNKVVNESTCLETPGQVYDCLEEKTSFTQAPHYAYPDMFEYYKCDLFTFIDIFTKAVGPTARKALEYKEKNPKNWERLIEKMEAIADPTSEADKDSKKAQEVSLSLDHFMECMKHWKAEIGIPRDLHAACADFVPGSANIMRVSEGALGEAFDRALIEAGGMPLQLTPELRMYDLPEEPRGELLPHAILFASRNGKPNSFNSPAVTSERLSTLPNQ
jgi:hypothetical protein